MAGLFSPQTHTLSNGLQIIVIPNGLSPTIDLSVIYKVGTADDPAEVHGISHFLEHMMFKGSKAFPGNQFTKRILEKGGSTNAFTSSDVTVYQTSISVEHVDLLLHLEADRMQNLSFEEKELISERNVVMEERRMRMDNHPFGTAIEVLYKALHTYHPYGIPPIGYAHHIENYTYASLFKHYRAWYAPNNAILLICGKVTLDQILPLIEFRFNGIPSRTILDRKRPQDPPREGITQHIVQYNPKNSLILSAHFYTAPHHKSHGLPLVFATIVLEQMLGGNETTDFYHHFVEDKKLALSVSGSYDPQSLDPQNFEISASLTETMDLEALKRELRNYIERLKAEGPLPQEVEHAKKDLLASFAFMKDGNGQAVHHFLGLAADMSFEALNNIDRGIQNVSLEDVRRAIQFIFKDPPFVVLDLFPQKKSTPLL